ncbi:MAG TPA: selenide, water dikinase SelD [Acetobacteraceae bacterium]|nr:selenide, water dikinase SelD [Acetobacteraceae bacterium]
MQKSIAQPVVKDLVLVGGGHSHVGVLKRFGMRPIPGVRLTMICRDRHTPYSGMLPGLVAGHYTFDEAHIDLGPLCRFAGARFYHDEAVGLDLTNQVVLCRAHPAVGYDILSLDIGSTPRTSDVPGATGNVVPVKPINRFIAHWQLMADRVLAHQGDLRIGVVGAGAGGVEILLAVQHRLRRMLSEVGRTDDHVGYWLFNAGEQILSGHNPRTRRIFERVLRERCVHVVAGSAVATVAPGRLATAQGTQYALDEILWVAAAGAAPWLAESGLRVDPQGFVAVNDTLRSLSHPSVFAAGDVAAVLQHPRPKSGVFAVRQGKPLAENLRRALLGRNPVPFQPQRNFLSLISTGDGSAVASRNNWAVEGRLMWRWKDSIDRRFMRQYSVLPEMAAPPPPALETNLAGTAAIEELSGIAMRCGGCGAKVGGTVLAQVLGTLHPVARPDILIGLDAPDDAAAVTVPPGKIMLHTVDYFRGLIDDPFVFGQVAANHSLGDIYAMGGEPQSALAIVTLPFGLESKMQDMLLQLMAGAVKVLNDAGTALVGGHTGEGAELAMGFAVNGLADPARLLRKAGMRPGDRLILTKPLGTGTLFAADMRGKAKGRWIDGALASMLQSSRAAAGCLHDHGATACTDVTGFGLLGHLVEMTTASGVDVELLLDALPLLDGAPDTVRLGIVSSLQPQNARSSRAVRDIDGSAGDARLALLFDPQTAGGLLASIPADKADACLAGLRRSGYAKAAIIGSVHPRTANAEPIALRR